MKKCFFLLSLIITLSCNNDTKTSHTGKAPALIAQQIECATGFTIKNHPTYKEITITSPWPDAKNTYTYLLYPKGTSKPPATAHTTCIEIPIDRIVVTSTTDIPILEYLEVENKLVGFPNTDYISSEKTRTLIDNDVVKELGNEQSINTELVLELQPDLILGFSANGNTKAYDLIQKTGIPVVMNGSWMEQHPLGRAEWIKFIAAFFNKEAIADRIFKDIKKNYTEATALVGNAPSSPTVLSGNMFKDIWYAPGGDSYVAQFFNDANTQYLWNTNRKTGSIPLSFESVLEKAQNADLWITTGNTSSLSELKEENNRYTLFDTFKNKAVYSSTLKTGAKGGFVYFELGPLRPDLILKDIIKIAHPELLNDYELYFFKKLN